MEHGIRHCHIIRYSHHLPPHRTFVLYFSLVVLFGMVSAGNHFHLTCHAQWPIVVEIGGHVARGHSGWHVDVDVHG